MATLVLPAELTSAQATACLGMLLEGLKQAGEEMVVADANMLERFDSSAIAVLLECRREAVALGKRFSVRAMPERLRELAGLYGVAGLLPAEP
ncbi:MAG: STAS domain-containing protein [Burkholderiales bacterium]